MKRIFLLGFSLSVSLFALSQDITGNWMGVADVMGQKLTAVFHIAKINNQYTASFDSPDQKAFGLPCDAVTITGDSLFIKMTVMSAVYKGKWNGTNSISGALAQGDQQFILPLSRVNETPKEIKTAAKPQTPKPPFNYDSEEIEYDNADKSVHYGATLTKPKGVKNFPTVIIISGSGSQDRDGTMLGHKLYWVLADYLSNHGIGVLRVDDRGTGKSTIGNNPKQLTSAVFSTDVETSFNYLLSRTDIDKKKIGLIGHSEGGIIAPMVAARRKDIAFVVLWGAASIGGLEINTEQNKYVLKKASFDSTAVDAFAQLHRKILGLFANTGKDELDNKVNIVFAEWKTGQSKEILSNLYVTDNTIVGQDIHKIYHSLYDIAWMRYFISYNPSVDLKKVSCPVLAINGMKDTQVDFKTNLSTIESVLTKAGNKHVQVKALPSLNHLLQTAKTGDLSEYETIEETMAPSAMALIANWINNPAK